MFWVAVSLDIVISKSDRQSWLAMAQAPASVRQQKDLVEEALQRGAWQVPNPEIGRRCYLYYIDRCIYGFGKFIYVEK